MRGSDLASWCVDDRRARFALAHVCDPSDAIVFAHCERHGAPATLARLVGGGIPHRDRDVYSLRWSRCDLTSEMLRADALGVRWLVPSDEEWPAGLDAVGLIPPHVIWVRGSGDVRTLCDFAIAIVGARACTHYGADVARAWAADLASSGLTIVSGGAFGIDVAAHSGALAASGSTVLVTAGGVDVSYPRAHEGLFRAVIERGCVISESPLGATVRRARFLTRNRVIAALSRATLVVEAARRSGSLSTARYAAELGHPVLAVPGPVTSGLSQGCHHLITERRAELVTSVRDIMTLLTGGGHTDENFTGMSVAHRALLDALPGSGSATLEDLVVASGLDRPQVEQAIRELTAMAQVLDGRGRWSRRPR